MHLQRVIDPLRLRLLLEVDRLGSITRAAEACSMAQPTASTHLRTLESAVGHRLVERAGRATRLTDAGRLLAQHAAVVVRALEELEADLAALADATTGSLVIASCDSFGIYALPTVLRAFTYDRPRAEIRVRIGPSGDVVRAVARGEAHMGIAGRARRSEQVVAEPLFEDELVWITAPHAGEIPRTVSMADVPNLTLIATGRDSSSRAIVERVLSQQGCRPAKLVELDSVEAVKRAVRIQLGVALVSRLAVTEELAAGELREIQVLGSAEAKRTIDLVHAEGRTLAPLEGVFAAALRRYAAGIGPQAREAALSRTPSAYHCPSAQDPLT
jgi:molybdate transport repressor ModE-like protein